MYCPTQGQLPQPWSGPDLKRRVDLCHELLHLFLLEVDVVLERSDFSLGIDAGGYLSGGCRHGVTIGTRRSRHGCFNDPWFSEHSIEANRGEVPYLPAVSTGDIAVKLLAEFMR